MRYYPIKKVSHPHELPKHLADMLHQLGMELDVANNCYRSPDEPDVYLAVKKKRLVREKDYLLAQGEWRWCYDIDQPVVRIVLFVMNRQYARPANDYDPSHSYYYDHKYDSTGFPDEAVPLLIHVLQNANLNHEAIIRKRKLRALLA